MDPKQAAIQNVIRPENAEDLPKPEAEKKEKSAASDELKAVQQILDHSSKNE